MNAKSLYEPSDRGERSQSSPIPVQEVIILKTDLGLDQMTVRCVPSLGAFVLYSRLYLSQNLDINGDLVPPFSPPSLSWNAYYKLLGTWPCHTSLCWAGRCATWWCCIIFCSRHCKDGRWRSSASLTSPALALTDKYSRVLFKAGISNIFGLNSDWCTMSTCNMLVFQQTKERDGYTWVSIEGQQQWDLSLFREAATLYLWLTALTCLMY